MASQQFLSGIPVYTQCQLQNHAGQKQYLVLDTSCNWYGSADPPETIQDQRAGDFQQDADAHGKGSIGGVAYVLGSKLKWIVAWSNARNVSNKVYTQILPMNEDIDWVKIKTSLDNSENKSSDLNKFGYSSVAIIEPNSPKPTMTATLEPAEPVA